MPKDWVIAPPSPDRDRIATALNVHPVVAQILCNRGLTATDEIAQFLRPQMADLHLPETLPGCTDAAERIVRAIRDGRKIVLYGDYDVDGVTGVAILWHCLRLCGAKADFYIPHRLEEGYGINVEAIDAVITDGAALIVSVDCGVTAIDAVRRAQERGAEIVITDHHQPHAGEDGTPTLPPTCIVHPGIAASDGRPAYANANLSGAGVAFKLAWAIFQRVTGATRVRPEFRDCLVDLLSLAALGTVADVVPLTGENRSLVRHGLLGLPKSRIPGIRALIETAGLTGKALDGYDIGFKMAPRLNAIGRMGHARLAVEMLTRAAAAEAMQIARQLEGQNRTRQALERRIATEARQMVAERGWNGDAHRALVLAGENWHAGVIGIVAGRMTEEFSRPTCMIALNNGSGQGSARSIANFPLHEALAKCGEHLISFGGHAMAAGFRIASDRVEGFREAFVSRAGQMLTHDDLRPKLRIDDVVPLEALDEKLIADLDTLEPFGAGNPQPRLATEELAVVGDPRIVGNSQDHLQVTLGDGRGQRKGIAFGMAKHRSELMDHRRCRVAFRPILNEWNGRRSVELQIIDFQFPT